MRAESNCIIAVVDSGSTPDSFLGRIFTRRLPLRVATLRILYVPGGDSEGKI